MPTTNVEYPINSFPEQDISTAVLNTHTEKIINLQRFLAASDRENVLATRSTAGLRPFAMVEGQSRIEGAFSASGLGFDIYVSDRVLFKQSNVSPTLTLIGLSDLLPLGRPSFASNETGVCIANGGPLIVTDGTTITNISAGDPAAPQTVSHVRYARGLCITLDPTRPGIIPFADWAVGTIPTNWDLLDFAQAEAEPDLNLAIEIIQSRIVVFGQTTIEFFRITGGLFVIVPIVGAEISKGIMSKFSYIKSEDLVYFWDERRRFTILNGLRATSIKCNFHNTVLGFEDISDSWMYYDAGKNSRTINTVFPSAGRTFFYDIDLGYWGERATLQPGGENGAYLANCYVFSAQFGQRKIGSKETSEIFLLDEGYLFDGDIPIKGENFTGFFDIDGSSRTKFITRIIIDVESGLGTETNPNTEQNILRVAYRTNFNTNFSRDIEIGLGVRGQINFRKEISVRIKASKIQFRFLYAGDRELIIGKMIIVVSVESQ